MTVTVPPPLWFVRHGQTDWNAQGRLQGQRDTPLNALGREQAADAARRLRGVLPDAPTELAYVASPLARAQESMRILRDTLGLDPDGFRSDPRLREIGFGSWEGSTWSEIRRRDPGSAAARDRDRWRYRAPGQGGESYAMLAERVAAALHDLDRPTVVVAHGGVARALLAVCGCLPPHAAARMGIRQGQVLAIDAAGWRWV